MLMWRDMKYSDFVLVARGGKELPCHKAVVAAASPVLESLLSSDMEEGRQGFVNVDEAQESLRTLLQYMYLGKLPWDANHSLLLTLMRLADYYQIQGLWKACESRLLPAVSKDNIVEVLGVLKPYEHVNEAYGEFFNRLIAVVKNDDGLLSQVCRSVLHKAFDDSDMLHG